MKKLIFLLLMAVALAGFVSAMETANPPWERTSGSTPFEAAMSEYGVNCHAVTPDTILALEMPAIAEPSSFQAVMALYNETAIQPQSGIMNISGMSLRIGQTCTCCAAGHYHLRC
ncbi:MAG: hypothetical protein LBH20_09385 [Treponema sp.]|jgi:predicted component of type VI protein secretion system|nr:hypothetical protein [Treponema sp.]